jgi:SAM-dependent methyltransferase
MLLSSSKTSVWRKAAIMAFGIGLSGRTIVLWRQCRNCGLHRLRKRGWMSLWSEFQNNDRRMIHKWKHYFPAYETHFARYVNRPVLFFEIGCGQGGSLQLWKRYLGPHARIVGVDIRPEVKKFSEDQIDIRIGDQSDTSFLESLLQEFGTPDVVLDDGSHVMQHIVTTFGFLYPRTANDGVYLVEDLHTAYWDEYGGGVKREGSFIELCKELIDELNADWSRGVLPPTEFTRSTLSMHFYDSMAIFERGRHLPKSAPQIPPESSGIVRSFLHEAKSKLVS